MKRGLASVLASLAISFAVEAHADSVDDAKREYDAGAAAYDKHDWATAALRFGHADELVPNPRALQLAMASATHLTDAPLAMSLVERAEARSTDSALAELARRLRARFAKDVGHVRVVCASKCNASVNGNPGVSHWLVPGTYRVVFDDGARTVEVTAGAEIEVTPPLPSTPPSVAIAPVAPPPPPPVARPVPEKSERHGLRPWIFWAGVGATGAAAGTAGVLTWLSKERHDDFVAAPSSLTRAEGEAAQTRAVALWIVAGGLLVATVVIALFTDFGK